MEPVQIVLTKGGRGAFYLREGEEPIGEMVFHIADGNMTVYHTEVSPEFEGKGLAGQLLNAMVEYARQHQLKVVPLCPYVHAQFKRHPERYEDVWSKEEAE
ncbi:GNAT family N-acetyltransferase [Larkinella sp. VNQ87]|uniref:GNAT family N-acetyltransferase n=1 Tax=Larkinella sp. VNQ87 TaxID=3400921 RepID=UPI003BFE2276